MIPLVSLTLLVAASVPPATPPLRFELVSSRWLTDEVVTVAYELTNASSESLEIAQHPGPSVVVTCATREGGFVGGVPGGVASECGEPDLRDRIALEPGRALVGQLAVRVPAACGDELELLGVYQSAHVGPPPGRREDVRAALHVRRAPPS